MSDHILVVDDDPEVRTLVFDAMEMLGFAAQKAVNGKEALDMARSDPPRAIILDLMMPVMDGFTTVAHLQGSKKLRHIPIILLSALTDSDPNIRRLPGVVGVMNKGQFSIDKLRLLLAEAGVVAA